LGSGEASRHVDVIVVPPQQVAGAEIEVLDGAVALDPGRKRRAQSTPSLVALPPRLDLGDGEARLGKESLCHRGSADA
jgi:hypothetical protein